MTGVRYHFNSGLFYMLLRLLKLIVSSVMHQMKSLVFFRDVYRMLKELLGLQKMLLSRSDLVPLTSNSS